MTKATKSNITHEMKQNLTEENSCELQLEGDKKTG